MKNKRRINLIVANGSYSRFRVGLIVLIYLMVAFPILYQYSDPSYGATYYVSPGGNDSNPGTEDQPWLTIQKAADTLVAGETVYIKAGTYQEKVAPQNSGSIGNYITYAVYPGDVVTVDGNGVSLSSGQDGLFNVSNKSYITISGLRIINAGPHFNSNGILVDNSSHVIIEKNYTYNTASSGIGVWLSDNITIDGNEVELACNGGEQECITVSGTDIFEIKNNHVHHDGPAEIGGEGIDAKDGSSNGKIYNNYVHHINGRVGIYVDAWNKHTYNIEVFQNRVHDVNDDGFTVASERSGLLENINIYNNIAYDNMVGITISKNGGPLFSHPMKNIRVINNTFYNNGIGDWGGGIYVDNPDVESAVIRNNICSQNLSFQIVPERNVPTQNLTVDHNLIDGFRGYSGEIYGNDYVEGDPLFVSPSGADFHLQEGSPAIDKGSSVDAPSTDFDANSRPQGQGYDIGAFEYGSGSVTTTIGPSTTTTIDPISTTTATGGVCLAEEIYGGNSEEAELMRYIRDNILNRTPEGQIITRLYYEWSPMIVDVMAKDEGLKKEVEEMMESILELVVEEE